MIVRAIDGDNDWQFGKGKNDYKSDLNAVSQNIKTRLQSFLNDCFFDANAGLDWWNLLGSKNQVGLTLSVSAIILKTEFVTKLEQLSLNLSDNREISISYKVQTAFSNRTEYVVDSVAYLLTEGGDVFITEGGDQLIL